MTPNPTAHHPARPAGFTLVELLIVVIILGLLAAVVIPAFANATRDARDRAFAANLRDLINSSQLYFQRWHALPPQNGGEPVPAAIFAGAGRADPFPTRTPLGGYWHVGHFVDVDRWGVGVWWPADEPDVASDVRRIDDQLDDGDGAKGTFQTREGARYYWLID